MRILILRALLILSLLLQLAGCMIGPDYIPPEIQAPADFSSSSVDPSFQGEPNLAAWWEHFNDPTLNELLRMSVDNNHELEIALARIDESRAFRRQSFNDLFPGARSAAGYTTRQYSDVGNQGPQGEFDQKSEYFSIGLDALWELDIFGRLRRGLEKREAEQEGAIANLDDVLRTVVAEVALTYIDLRGTQHRLTVARKNAENQLQTAELVDALVIGGKGTELDRARARAQLGRTKATVPDLEATERIDMHRLAVLTGRAPGSLVDKLKEISALPTYSGPIGLGTPDQLLRRRPDVRVAERKVAAATAGVGIAYGDLFPIINFTGNFSFEAGSASRLGDSGTAAYSFGPSISWIALDIGKILAGVDAADALVLESLAGYQQTLLLALEDTENAMVRFAKQRERRDLLLGVAKESRKAADLATTQFREGLTDLLTVLEAERDALDADDTLMLSETTLVASLIGIYKALGGGWEDSPEKKIPAPQSEQSSAELTF